MPANLTPEYERAEKAFRQATSDAEKLDALREMLRAIPKHKGTEKMQADLKRRISQFRKSEAKRKGPGKGADPFHVPPGGAGQVVLIGAPNVGKSMLLAATTHAEAKVADYPFTTAVPQPGMWPHEDTQIQLVDTPPIMAEHLPGGLFGTIRMADVVCVMVDAAGDALAEAEMVLQLLDGRGMLLRSAPRSEMDPLDHTQRSGILVANKIDQAAAEDIETFRQLYSDRLEVWPISAATGEGLDALRQRLWELLAVVRVYTKQPGRPADKDKPFTLDRGATVEDLAREIHRELPDKMKFARIWNAGRFDGQQVHRTEELCDKDIVEIHE